MENKLTPITWYADFKERFQGQAIDDDFMMSDDFSLLPTFDYPFKLDMIACLFCVKGKAKGKINLKNYEIVDPPCIIVILPDQILELEYFSDDFEGHIVMMSKRFQETLLPLLKDRGTIFLQISKNPCLTLDEQSISFFYSHVQIIKSVIANPLNLPHRIEIIKHLSLSIFFYLYDTSIMKPDNSLKNNPLKRKIEFAEKFMELVEIHYKTQRQVRFYANNLNITPKYLSQIVKSITGKSTNDWIDDYVILEAKALLKSTNMTVQQISNDLNFPSQSFFGKYFKRLTGLSPKQYRES